MGVQLIGVCAVCEDHAFLLWFAHDVIVANVHSGGENISSIEVEAALHQHDSVENVAVVALPDPFWGESPVAVVETKPGTKVIRVDIFICVFSCPYFVLHAPCCNHLPRMLLAKGPIEIHRGGRSSGAPGKLVNFDWDELESQRTEMFEVGRLVS